MAKFIYAGPATNLGRFGAVAQGAVLDLTAEEAASVATNAQYFAQPVAGKTPLFKSSAYTLVTVTDSGKKLASDHGAAVTYTLPATPTAGDNFEIEFTDDAFAAGFNITVARNGNPIDGAGSDFTITPAISRKGFYWNGATWVSY